MFSRRTKIVATLGPATDQPGVLDALVAAGIDCARLNCSHGTREDLRRRAAVPVVAFTLRTRDHASVEDGLPPGDKWSSLVSGGGRKHGLTSAHI